MEDTMDILMLTGVDKEDCRQHFWKSKLYVLHIFFVSNIWHAFKPKNFIIACFLFD